MVLINTKSFIQGIIYIWDSFKPTHGNECYNFCFVLCFIRGMNFTEKDFEMCAPFKKVFYEAKIKNIFVSPCPDWVKNFRNKKFRFFFFFYFRKIIASDLCQLWILL